MNLVHLASGDLWAGAEKQIFTLLYELSSSKFAPSAIILNPGELADRLLSAGIDTLILDESKDNFFTLRIKIREFLKQHKADIVHTHGFKANILGAISVFGLRMELACTRHGSHEFAIGRLDIQRQFLRGLNHILETAIIGKIVVVAEHMLLDTKSKQLRRKLVLIPNGIALPEDRNVQLNSDKRWKIGIVGRLVQLKRVDIFIEFAKQLCTTEKYADKLEFRVIGDGPLRDELESMSIKNGLQNKVCFTGHVGNSEEEIAKLDILTICSDHEGLPMVALEAMASKTIVIAHKVGGLSTLLDDGCGYLIETQNPSSYAEKIRSVVEEPLASKAIHTSARKKIERYFSANHMANEYCSLYSLICKKKRFFSQKMRP